MNRFREIIDRVLDATAHANVGNMREFEELLDRRKAHPEARSTPHRTVATPKSGSVTGIYSRITSIPRRLLTRSATMQNSRVAAGGAHIVRRRKEALKDDLVAGITVALVAIPQSLAYAQLAGVPAYYGLYAALVPTIVGAVCGSSRQVSTGPVAMTSLLTAASIAPLAGAGTSLYAADVILLALFSGLFQLGFGLLRAGVLLNFLSQPVLIGFINAAALIIGLSQLPAVLGISLLQSDYFLLDIWGVLSNINTVHAFSLAFGIAAIVMLIVFRKFASRLPGVLVTVSVLTWLSYQIDYSAMGGRVVGDIPQGLPAFGMPSFDWQTFVELVPASFVIAVISFMEAMSSAKVISIRTRQPWNENRELIGQGLAKIAAAFSHTMPVSGSFSRSALNLASNAQSPLSSVFAAFFVLMTLLFFTPLLYHLPKPVLGAIIMMAVVGLINVRAVGQAWLANRDDGIAAIATFVATLAFAPNIQSGMVTGITLSLALLLYRLMRPRILVRCADMNGNLHEITDPAIARARPALGVIHFDGALRFVNVSYFENSLLRLERTQPTLKCILIQCHGVNALDASGVAALVELVKRFRANGISLAFSAIRPHVRDVMDRTGLSAVIGGANIFHDDEQAIRILNSARAVT